MQYTQPREIEFDIGTLTYVREIILVSVIDIEELSEDYNVFKVIYFNLN